MFNRVIAFGLGEVGEQVIAVFTVRRIARVVFGEAARIPDCVAVRLFAAIHFYRMMRAEREFFRVGVPNGFAP